MLREKKLIIDQKLENYINEQNYQYQLKSLQLQLKTLKSTHEFELEKDRYYALIPNRTA